ncbi:MAG: DMT family transporter [Rhodospirillales bacterium]|nr:DMT family transporter [Rhodospirillales bacterium]
MTHAPAQTKEVPDTGRLTLGTGFLLLAVLTVLWGVNWPIMKRAVTEVPAWTFRGICLFGAGAGFVLICGLARQSFRVPRGQVRPLLIVSFFNVTIWHICSATGLVHLAASRATIIAFTMPLWAAVLAVPLLGERPTLYTIGGLAAGLAGMLVLILPQYESVLTDPVGPVAMLVAAMSWATGTVALKYYRFTMPVAALTGWQLMLGGIPVVLGAIVFERDFEPGAVSWGAWLATAYAVLVATLFCHWAWFKLVHRFPAVAISVGSLAIPVVGVLASAIGLGEPIGWDALTALALVLTALFLVLILPAQQSR